MTPPTEPHAKGPWPNGSISLFWRTFLLLGLLLLGSSVAWFQTFRALEEEPRALQNAQQLASLVNLTRAALVHADPIARISLVTTLVDQENVRIAVREANDSYQPHNLTRHDRLLSQVLDERLGESTIVAREVNGFGGLWIGFYIGQDSYWLLLDPERIDAVGGFTWLVWLSIAASLSLLGALAITGFINHPLQRLSAAAARIRAGDLRSARLDEAVPTAEIRAVNVGFNRMAEQLAQAEVDRTLMLAGISHDLRTPLARLRLETEMSVPDALTRELMVADIEQIDAIIDKFMDYARSGRAPLQAVWLQEVVLAAWQPWRHQPDVQVHWQLPHDLCVLADPVELRRVVSNLIENAVRYGRSADGVVRLDVGAQPESAGLAALWLRDHGPGASAQALPHLCEPFYRADMARTSAAGAGLGLAIVQKTVQRMGGTLALSNHPQGGLMARLTLRTAPIPQPTRAEELTRAA